MAGQTEFTDALRKRSDQGDYWWELRACDYYREMEAPKIVTKDVADHPSSYLDLEGTFVDTTMSFLADSSYEALAILNSHVAHFHVKLSSSAFQGGFPRFKTQYLRSIPVPEWTNAEIVDLRRHAETCSNLTLTSANVALSFARRISDLCPPERDAKLSTKLRDWHELPDFAAFRAEVKKCFKADIPLNERNQWQDLFDKGKAEIEKLSAEITRNEDEINAIVYKLFDLTTDEIALLEESIGVTKAGSRPLAVA